MERNNLCCFCGKPYRYYGNSTWGCWSPIQEMLYEGEKQRCCDSCNELIVLPQRVENMLLKKQEILESNQ